MKKSNTTIQPKNLVLMLAIVFFAACTPPPVQPAYTETPVKKTVTSTAAIKIPTDTKQITETPLPELVQKIDVDPQRLQDETVTFWHTWNGEVGDVVEQIASQFNESNEWGIKVEAVYQGNPDIIDTKIIQAVESGELPDLVLGYLHQAQEWENAEMWVDLGDYINDPMWGFSVQDQDDFYRVFWEHDVEGGRRIGMPVQRFGQVLLYNVSWAHELGFDTGVDSPESFKEQACAAYYANLLDDNEENDGTGGWIVSEDYTTTLGWIYSFGGEIVAPGGTEASDRVYKFNTPENRDAFRFLMELFNEGCAWKSSNQFAEQDFAGRRGLFATANVAELANIEEAFRAQGNNDDWITIPFPSPQSSPSFDVFGPSLFLYASTVERQLAGWLFLKWLVDPEQQAKLIEKAGSLPVRKSSMEYLEDYRTRHKHWSQAASSILIAKSEPTIPSWKTVRWALSDATRQLYTSYFTIEEIPELMDFLDQTAHELHLGPDESGLLDTPTFTPTITFTPSNTPTATLTPSATVMPLPSATNTASVSAGSSPNP